MVSGGDRRDDDGAVMPSWSTSSPSTPQPTVATTPEAGAAEDAAAIERAKRVLAELLAGRQPGDPPPRPDK